MPYGTIVVVASDAGRVELLLMEGWTELERCRVTSAERLLTSAMTHSLACNLNSTYTGVSMTHLEFEKGRTHMRVI
jgi:hypothetical protein